jgi:class 3 adenylate cyclase
VALGSVWSGVTSVTALTLLGFAFVGASLAGYALTGLLLPPVAPVLALAISGGGARAWRGWWDRRDRQALRALFSRFVSAPVVDQIMRERDLFMAGGRPRPQELTATVLYADVAGFTGICERLAPEPLIAWTDAYLEAMTALIMAHQGVVLRFIGDGILAVFGVPVPRRTEAEIAADARHAAECAIEMERAMARLNADWAAQGLPVGGLRVGLHTGPMVAGSLGRGARMEFCLLGDTANVGARLEQLGKQYAEHVADYCTIVIGGPTRAHLGPDFPALRIGDMPLRGRQATLEAYRIDSAAAKMLMTPGPPYPAAPPGR